MPLIRRSAAICVSARASPTALFRGARNVFATSTTEDMAWAQASLILYIIPKLKLDVNEVILFVIIN